MAIQIDVLLNADGTEKSIKELRAQAKGFKKDLESATDPKEIERLTEALGQTNKALKDFRDDLKTVAADGSFKRMGIQAKDFGENIKNLNFKDAAGDLNNLAITAKGIDFKSLSAGITAVTGSVSTLGSALWASGIAPIALAVVGLTVAVMGLLNSMGLVKPIMDAVTSSLKVLSDAFKLLTDFMGVTTNEIDGYAQTTIDATSESSDAWKEHVVEVENATSRILQGLDDQIELLEAQGASEETLRAAQLNRLAVEKERLLVLQEELQTRTRLQILQLTQEIKNMAIEAAARDKNVNLLGLQTILNSNLNKSLTKSQELKLKELGLTDKQIELYRVLGDEYRASMKDNDDLNQRIRENAQKTNVTIAKSNTAARNAQNKVNDETLKDLERLNEEIETLNEELWTLGSIASSDFSKNTKEGWDEIETEARNFVEGYKKRIAGAVGATDELQKKYEKYQEIIYKKDEIRFLKSNKDKIEAQKAYYKELQTLTETQYDVLRRNYTEDLARWKESKDEGIISDALYNQLVLAGKEKLTKDIEALYKREAESFSSNFENAFDQSKRSFLWRRLKNADDIALKDLGDLYKKETDKIKSTLNLDIDIERARMIRKATTDLLDPRYFAEYATEIIMLDKKLKGTLEEPFDFNYIRNSQQNIKGLEEAILNIQKNVLVSGSKISDEVLGLLGEYNLLNQTGESPERMQEIVNILGDMSSKQNTLNAAIATGDSELVEYVNKWNEFRELRRRDEEKSKPEGDRIGLAPLSETEKTQYELLKVEMQGSDRRAAVILAYYDLIEEKQKQNSVKMTEEEKKASDAKLEELNAFIKDQFKILNDPENKNYDPAFVTAVTTGLDNLGKADVQYTNIVEENAKKREEIRKKEAILSKETADKIQKTLQATNDINETFSILSEARMNREITAAKGNEDKIEKARKDAFKREKNFARNRALINGAVAVTNALMTPPFPLGAALAAIALAKTAAEVALINSTSYDGMGSRTSTPPVSSSSVNSTSGQPRFEWYGGPNPGASQGATGERMGGPGTPIEINVNISETEITSTQNRVLRMTNVAQL
jgi:hypothetical protein